MASACPTCGTPRIGSFRYCRSCGLDYDTLTGSESTSGSPASPPVVERPAASIDPTAAGSSVAVAGDPDPSARTRRSRRLVAIVGTIIVAVIVGGLAVGGIAAGPSASPDPAALPSAAPVAVAVAVATASATPSVAVATPSPTPIPTASPPPPPALVALPRLTEKVPGVTTVKYFPVNAASPAGLLDNVVLRSKASCKSADTLACVDQRDSIRWTERTRLATGACTIVAPKVSLRSTVYLPQWVGPKQVQPALLEWWKRMVDHLAWHEAQHIKIEKSWDSKLKTMMVGRKCSSANSIIRKWQASRSAAQDAFDVKDASWPYPAFTGPGGWFGTQ